MYASHRLRAVVLLAATALWACSDDSSSGGPPDAEEGLPEFAAGDAQVSPAVRTAIADLLAELGTNAAADPELAGVLGAVGAAVVNEGWVTGVTASSALRGGGEAASLVSGTWGVFAVTVGVFPAVEQPFQAYYTAVVALRGNEAAIGIKKAQTQAELIDASAEFPDPKARGLLFQGRSRGWGAVAGYTQVIEKAADVACGGTQVTGIVCLRGMASAGLEIDESVPLTFSGNSATGTRTFALPYGDVRGYHLEVYCDQVSFC